MGIFLLMAIAGMVTLEDLQDYMTDILNIKEGTLTRTQYFACTWLITFVLAILGSVFLGIVGFDITGAKTFGYYIAYALLYLVITVVQISAFMRRMNDACLTKWYTLVFLVPGIGNILAFIIAMMPTGFGSPY